MNLKENSLFEHLQFPVHEIPIQAGLITLIYFAGKCSLLPSFFLVRGSWPVADVTK
jgi:hypothetical protein